MEVLYNENHETIITENEEEKRKQSGTKGIKLEESKHQTSKHIPGL